MRVCLPRVRRKTAAVLVSLYVLPCGEKRTKSLTNPHHFMRRSIYGLTIICALIACSLQAQNNNPSWLDTWQNPASNYFTIKHVFDSTFAGVEQEMRNHTGVSESRESEREEGAKDGSFRLFKRWEWYYAPRVGASGDLTLPAYSYINFFQYLEQNPAAMAMHRASIAHDRAATPGWTFIGPTGAPNGGGAGRLNFVRIDPTNNNIIYVGAPAGGCWKSTNGGQSWTCLTDFLPVIGCSDLAIDPSNPQVLYLGTGDQDGGDSPSIGVLKSIDGGLTWNNTGLNFNIILSKKIARILIDPTNTSIVYCGTSSGIYKTYDAGANWTLLTGSGVKDMEMKPGDPNTLYACRTTFIMSANGGATWTTIGTGLPMATIVSRLAIATTDADPNYVYVVAGNASTQGFEGIYRSTNSGVTFTPMSDSPNLLGWDEQGGDSDGQAWYTLSIAASPVNRDVVIVGGVNIWRSDDGGSSWNLNAHWYGGGGAPYVHADIHDLYFLPGSQGDLYVGCDGGIFITTDDGGSYQDLSANLCIAQIYKMGQSTTDASTIITGHQDNGTNVKSGAAEEEVLGGDGMDCFIDWSNDMTMYASIYYGDFYKSTNGGANFSGCTSGLSGNAGWVTPWKQDPNNPSIIYTGWDQVFKTTNAAGTWTQLGTLPNSASLTEIEVAPSNTQYLYVTNANVIWRSTDGGSTYTNITSGINTSGSSISGIAVNPYNENMVWISMSGYNSTNKCYITLDAGTTWINVSSGLPNIPANCVMACPNTGNNLVFIGMDAGVYYRHDFSNGWQPYFSALPMAPVSDFEVYEQTMMLRASTYGRGVWECAIDPSLISPLALFTANQTMVCPGTTIQFTDNSMNGPTQWNWSFPGGNPSASTAQNPAITYSTPGTYPVSLTISAPGGSDAEVQNSYITVSGGVVPPYTEGFVATTFLPTGWTAVNNANQSHYWQRSNTIGYNSTNSAFFNNHDQSTNGATDDMRTMPISLSGYGNPQLTFDVAYRRYSATRSDTLVVLVSADCGATWTQVYYKGGTTLSTVSGDQVSSFFPTNSQWRNESVNLSAYANAPTLMIAFRNIGDHGNYLYVDNINLTATVNTAPVAQFYLPQACMMDSVSFNGIAGPAPTAWNWNFQGGSPATSTAQNASAIWSVPGTYSVTLIVTNAVGSDTVMQTVTVNGLPTVDAGTDSTFCSGTNVTLHGTGGVSYSWTPVTNMYYPVLQDPTVSVTTTTTFTMNATDGLGCTSSDTVRINVNSLPGFTTTASPSNICPGDTSILSTSNNFWQFTWSPAADLNTPSGDTILAFPQNTTTYTVTAVDTSTGCMQTGTRTLNVFAYLPTPTVLVWGWTITCSVPAASYQWYLNGNPIVGATSQSYAATQIGMYTVEAFNTQGCSSGVSGAVLVDAIPDVQVSSFSIYPNPNQGVFWISFNGEQHSEYSIDIIAADGRIVQSEKLQDFSGEYREMFDLSSFGAGAYMIRITHDNAAVAYRTIIF